MQGRLEYDVHERSSIYANTNGRYISLELEKKPGLTTTMQSLLNGRCMGHGDVGRLYTEMNGAPRIHTWHDATVIVTFRAHSASVDRDLS